MPEFIAFVISLIIFIWFGYTLNAIKRNTEETAAQTKRQTRILQQLGDKYAPSGEETEVPSAPVRRCDPCNIDFPPDAVFCPGCGRYPTRTRI
jgi:hypothetical protein